MIDNGLRTQISCIDTSRLPAQLAGRKFDHNFLDSLPDGIDPCGENGEFHTFVSASPSFSKAIEVVANRIVEREGFAFADLVPVTPEPSN